MMLRQFALICLALLLPLQAQAVAAQSCHGGANSGIQHLHHNHHADDIQFHGEQSIQGTQGEQSAAHADSLLAFATPDTACLHCSGCCPGFTAVPTQPFQALPIMASVAPHAWPARFASGRVPDGPLRPPR